MKKNRTRRQKVKFRLFQNMYSPQVRNVYEEYILDFHLIPKKDKKKNNRNEL